MSKLNEQTKANIKSAVSAGMVIDEVTKLYQVLLRGSTGKTVFLKDVNDINVQYRNKSSVKKSLLRRNASIIVEILPQI